MSGTWLREEQTGLAVDKLLDAAGRAFAADGVQASTMARVAAEAGCSRATLYTYFPNRRALHVAFVNRAALDIARRAGERLAVVSDPAERLVEGVLSAVAEVRAVPQLAVWFTAPDVGIATELSNRSEVLDAITEAFMAGLGVGDETAGNHAGNHAGNATDDQDEGGLEHLRPRARWVVRVVVSLLSMPAADPAEERAIVEQFVVPSVLGAPVGSPAGDGADGGS